MVSLEERLGVIWRDALVVDALQDAKRKRKKAKSVVCPKQQRYDLCQPILSILTAYL
jgi:MoaA/NifB/PqqE/SkfB family radical SAM enzyme